MRCFCCAESAESEMVLPAVRDRDDAAPISKAAIGSPTLGPTRKAKTFQVGMNKLEDSSSLGDPLGSPNFQETSKYENLIEMMIEHG